MLLLLLFCRGESRGTKRLSYQPKVAQLEAEQELKLGHRTPEPSLSATAFKDSGPSSPVQSQLSLTYTMGISPVSFTGEGGDRGNLAEQRWVTHSLQVAGAAFAGVLGSHHAFRDCTHSYGAVGTL